MQQIYLEISKQQKKYLNNLEYSEFMDVNNRIKEFCSWYSAENKITQKELSELIEISASQLSSIINGRDKVGLLIVEKFLNLDSRLDANWLLTGKGEMLKIETDHKPKQILSDVRQEVETRPRIPMDAAAGSLSVAQNGVTNNDCEQLPIIKAFAQYDFTIFARGDSMFPEYHSGDELACLFIKNTSFVQWGRVHVLDTAQGVVLKRIFDNGEHILCRSLNPDYSEFTIHKSEVYNIALVIGLIRRY